MERLRTSYPVLFLCALIVTLAVPLLSAAQTDSGQSTGDTVFTDLRLTSEGVTAVDVDGVRWQYDFSKEKFVVGAPSTPAGEVGSESFPREGADIPIEERALEPKVVKRIEQQVIVGYDEYVDGDVIAIDRVVVKGWVKGNVTSYRRRVLVTESGRVDGDIRAPSVIIKDGGVHLGRIYEETSPLDIEDLARDFSPAGIIVVLSFTVALVVLAFIAVLVFPRQYNNLYYCQRFFAGRSLSLGLVMTVLVPFVITVVALTIVGVFVIPLIPLAYAVAYLLGVVGFGQLIGRRVSERFLSGERSIAFQAVLGTILFMWPWIAAAALMTSADGGFWYGLGVFLMVVSIVFSCYPILTGLGAAFLTRFGFRSYQGSRKSRGASEDSDTPAPPPIPTAPPTVGMRGVFPHAVEPPPLHRGPGPLTQPDSDATSTSRDRINGQNDSDNNPRQ
jgi:hypothetical protein